MKLLLGNLSGLEPDPQSLATGGFAGVVKGNIQIENCNVENLHGVSNVNDRTGGFAGYVSGMTQYDLISNGLGGLVTTLTKILNLIPLLGAGDLLTVLLNGGLLSVKKSDSGRLCQSMYSELFCKRWHFCYRSEEYRWIRWGSHWCSDEKLFCGWHCHSVWK